MVALIVGSSNAGKSTYIRKVGYFPVAYGHQLRGGDVPADGAIHYNLLHHAFVLHRRDDLRPVWDLRDEPILDRIVASRAVRRAKVIVASLTDLHDRAARRALIEPGLAKPGDYPRHIWGEILDRVDLPALHDRLFDLLDASNIPFEILYSDRERGAFHRTDRALVPGHLSGGEEPAGPVPSG